MLKRIVRGLFVAVAASPIAAVLGILQVPHAWRSESLPAHDPLRILLAELQRASGVTEPVRLLMYRTHAGEAMNASTDVGPDGLHRIFISDHYRTASPAAVLLMLAHELGHVAARDCYADVELPVMQVRADAFALRLVGERVFLEGMSYAGRRLGAHSYQGDLLRWRVYNTGEERARKRLSDAKAHLAEVAEAP